MKMLFALILYIFLISKSSHFKTYICIQQRDIYAPCCINLDVFVLFNRNVEHLNKKSVNYK